LQLLLTSADLAIESSREVEEESVAMAVRMVFEPVPAGRHVLGQRAVGRGQLSDEEERSQGLPPFEQVEHRRRHVRIGAVVEGQHDGAFCRSRR
jgi:hypothetical protein